MGVKHSFLLPPLIFSVYFAISSSCGWKISRLGALSSSPVKTVWSLLLPWSIHSICLPQSSWGDIFTCEANWYHPLFKISNGFWSHLSWNTIILIMPSEALHNLPLVKFLVSFSYLPLIHTFQPYEPLVLSRTYVSTSGTLRSLLALPAMCFL